MNKEIYKQELPSFFACYELGLLCGMTPGKSPGTFCSFYYAPGIGITGMPFTRNWVADTITLSPTFKPDETE